MRSQALTIHSARGLTLVEATLALLIAALVLSLVYGSVKGISGSVESVSARNDVYRTTYALLDEIERELSAAFLGIERTKIPGATRTYFHVENEEEAGLKKAVLYFTTFGHAFSPNPIGEADQSEVCYKAVYDHRKEELLVLKREDLTTNAATCKHDDRAFDMDNPVGQRPYVVASGVHPEKGPGYRLVGFEVILLDPGQQGQLRGSRRGRTPTKEDTTLQAERSAEATLKSVTSWDTEDDITQTNRLPRQVRVSLTYEGPSKELITFSRTAWLQLSGSIIQTAGALEREMQVPESIPQQ